MRMYDTVLFEQSSNFLFFVIISAIFLSIVVFERLDDTKIGVAATQIRDLSTSSQPEVASTSPNHSVSRRSSFSNNSVVKSTSKEVTH